MAFYSYKRAADDIKELARQMGVDKVFLGGHDWGGAVVYRIALWYPEFVNKVFSVCTPFWAPSSTFVPLEEIVKSKWPNFRYQLHLASGEVEKHIQSKKSIWQFLNACYGGKGPNGEFGIDVTGTTKFEDLHKLGKAIVITAEMLDYYAEQYARNGMHGTCKFQIHLAKDRCLWLRHGSELVSHPRTKLSGRTSVGHAHPDYLHLLSKLIYYSLDRTTIDVPCLFIQATEDKALPPVMSEGMERYIPNLTRKSIKTGHCKYPSMPICSKALSKEQDQWFTFLQIPTFQNPWLGPKNPLRKER